MNELRKDYILNRWVIIAIERSKRPNQFIQKERIRSDTKMCPFCTGNEHLMTSVVDEINQSKILVRSIFNKFPAVKMDGNPDIRTDNQFYTYASAYGQHEVIVETPDHGVELEDLPHDHIKAVIDMYIRRINALDSLPHIKYVSIFKNRGSSAGASIDHAHSQLIAYNYLPVAVENELKTLYEYFILHESCPYCEIIKTESKSFRHVFENDSFISFTPYASRHPYEVWIFPKKHLASIVLLNEKERWDLAEIMKKLLMRLDALNYPPYNVQIHNALPNGENFHFHIEIAPRLSTWAGFELETETVINVVSPEDAAKFYRGEVNTQ